MEDNVAELLSIGLQELPQKPFFGVAAELQQLNPICGGALMLNLCKGFPPVELKTIFRATDSKLLDLPSIVRVSQPLKEWMGELVFALRSYCCTTISVSSALCFSTPQSRLLFAV